MTPIHDLTDVELVREAGDASYGRNADDDHYIPHAPSGERLMLLHKTIDPLTYSGSMAMWEAFHLKTNGHIRIDVGVRVAILTNTYKNTIEWFDHDNTESTVSRAILQAIVAGGRAMGVDDE